MRHTRGVRAICTPFVLTDEALDILIVDRSCIATRDLEWSIVAIAETAERFDEVAYVARITPLAGGDARQALENHRSYCE